MKLLDRYYIKLFQKSQRYEKIKNRIMISVLVLLSISLYASGVSLYTLTVVAIVFQSVALYLNFKSKKLRALGGQFQKLSMLSTVFNNEPDKGELSELKIKAGLDTYNKIFDDLINTKESESLSYTSKSKKPESKLLEMIQENCHWNNNLYRFSYKDHLKKVAATLTVLVIGVLISIPQIKLDDDFTLIRLLLTVISFSIVYDFFESMLKYRESSQEMKELDCKIERSSDINLPEILNIFSQYILIKETTPSIPKRIYENNKNLINATWNIRANEA